MIASSGIVGRSVEGVTADREGGGDVAEVDSVVGAGAA